MGRKEICKEFGRKPEGKKPLGKPKSRWEDEVRMDLGEIRWGVDCIQLLAVLKAVMNLRVPKPRS
jgi:hypothetical protein